MCFAGASILFAVLQLASWAWCEPRAREDWLAEAVEPLTASEITLSGTGVAQSIHDESPTLPAPAGRAGLREAPGVGQSHGRTSAASLSGVRVGGTNSQASAGTGSPIHNGAAATSAALSRHGTVIAVPPSQRGTLSEHGPLGSTGSGRPGRPAASTASSGAARARVRGAAPAQPSGGSSAGSSSSPDTSCLVCRQAPASVVLLHAGHAHMCVCEACAAPSSFVTCPACDSPFSSKLRTAGLAATDSSV